MNTYLLLIRGINVGGKNIISMAALRTCLEEIGYQNISTYIASGNVIVQSDKQANEVKAEIENNLPKTFALDSELIKVLVLTKNQLQTIVSHKPIGFGDHPEMYHYDIVFLIDTSVQDALNVFSPKVGVDRIWPGTGVVYSERLSVERTKSRLNKIMSTPVYKSMTIRTWNTTIKLLALLEANV